MKLINTEGMAFIGPGSEWFRTAVSGLVLAVTFIAIYRQLSIARGANAFEQMSRISSDLESERMTRSKLEVLVALRDEASPENLPEGPASFVADYWENVASLCRAGHVDRKVVRDNLGSTCRWWWAALDPFTRRARIDNSDPTIGEHHEWLAGVMAALDEKAGVRIAYDAALLAQTRDGRIQRCRDDIRMAEELRAVIVRRTSPSEPSPPPTAAQDDVATAHPTA